MLSVVSVMINSSNKSILQTLIYFYDPIEVEQDQLIEGSATLSQSKENARFMNIHLEYA
jgi:protein arginine N-methyltransferase 6